MTLTNNIIAGNTSGVSNGMPVGDVANGSPGSISTTGVNFIGDIRGSGLAAGPTILTGNPLLAPLADNGGPTKTMALLPGSPAIDAAPVIPGLDTDQRGFSRNRDGDSIAGAQPDIGAYEAQVGPGFVVPGLSDNNKVAAVTTAADESDPNGPLGTGISLREALRDVAPGGGIVFDDALSGQSLSTNSELVVGKSVIIDASSLGAEWTVSGSNAHRVFRISPGVTAGIRRLRIADGLQTGTTLADYGAGLFIEGTVTLTKCSLTGNSAAVGGGAFVASGGASLTLERCRVFGNTAGFGGGIENRGSLVAGSSYFAGNSTTQDGGAIRNNTGTSTLESCTLSDNSAQASGGAIFNMAGSATSLTHCTITRNSNGNTGGGIRNDGTLTLTNSIVAGNIPVGPSEGIFNAATLNAVGANIVRAIFNGGTINGTGNISATDPLLVPLVFGPLPMAFGLGAGSPAIDAAVGSTASTDQRGFYRPVDGDSNARPSRTSARMRCSSARSPTW